MRFSVKKIACSPVVATNLHGPSGSARDDKFEGGGQPGQWLLGWMALTVVAAEASAVLPALRTISKCFVDLASGLP